MKKTYVKIAIVAFAIILAIVLMLASCSSDGEIIIEPTVDPYEGMVQVNVGASIEWVPEVEGLPVSVLDVSDFTAENGYVSFNGDAMHGIDVSEHQLEIDWEEVAASGLVEFAMIRAAYRGYSEGGVFDDLYVRENIEGAIENDIPVGVYFFSQAVTVEEAIEEAEYLVDLISGYDITLPVAYDWERIGIAEARTDDVTETEMTDFAVAFCEVIKENGYTPAVYFFRHMAYYEYDLARLSDYEFWIGAPGEVPDFYYAHDTWQYSYTGKIPGIEGDVDMNLRFPKDVIYPVIETVAPTE